MPLPVFHGNADGFDFLSSMEAECIHKFPKVISEFWELRLWNGLCDNGKVAFILKKNNAVYQNR
jgi:hypothetical protein